MPLTDMDLEAVRTEAAANEERATQRAGTGAVLWQSRLDMVLATKDAAAVHELLTQDVSPPPWKDRKCK
jgi:hypothetical protein